MNSNAIAGSDARVLITGAAGFIGARVVASLLKMGFSDLRCFVRPSSDLTRLRSVTDSVAGANIDIISGNLLSADDCAAATRNISIVLHLAAGRGSKSFPDAFLNSVITTRNLLDCVSQEKGFNRFVNVSSFAVYANRKRPSGQPLDETCPIETLPGFQRDPYCFAKLKQEAIVAKYGRDFDLPYVIVRPGVVYGPGNVGVHARVGIGTFGLFLHCGGSNPIPFTYVDNCADAIVLAGLTPGVVGEVFNIVDDDLPSSRQFLRLYKKHVVPFRSLYLPHAMSYGLSYLWERYSQWSKEQLPNAFNRDKWSAAWRKTNYNNAKAKARLGWMPRVATEDGLRDYFRACRA